MRGVGHACGDKRTISKDQLSPRMQVPGTELKSPVLVTSAFKITEQSSQHKVWRCLDSVLENTGYLGVHTVGWRLKTQVT